MLNYLNNADALDRGEATLRAIRWEWLNYQMIYNRQNGVNIDVVTAWDTWYKDYLQTRFATVKSWLVAWALDADTNWGGSTDPLSQTVQSVLALYLSRARQLGGYNDLGYPTGTPTSYQSP